jgi:hypothetical protein
MFIDTAMLDFPLDFLMALRMPMDRGAAGQGV